MSPRFFFQFSTRRICVFCSGLLTVLPGYGSNPRRTTGRQSLIGWLVLINLLTGLQSAAQPAEALGGTAPAIDQTPLPQLVFRASQVLVLPPARQPIAADPIAPLTSQPLAFDHFLHGLQTQKIIDDNQIWQGGNTQVVALGDPLTRDSASAANLDVIKRLQDQARVAGGRLHILLGSPELRRLVRATQQEPSNVSPDSLYGRWLLSLPTAIKIDRTIFTHGGLPPLVATLGLEGINRNALNALQATMTNSSQTIEQRAALSTSGPIWYAGTDACHALIESQPLLDSLRALGADRVVSAATANAVHPVTNTPISPATFRDRFGGRAITLSADDNHTSALRITNTKLELLGGTDLPTRMPWSHSVLLVPPGDEADLEQALAAAELQLQREGNSTNALIVNATITDGREFRGLFLPVNRREVDRAIATMRLDRWLGLHMVPVTVKHRLGRRRGYVQFSPGTWIDEATRAQLNLPRPSHCAAGHAYHLITAFDALIGAEPRSPRSLSYDPAHWRIRITDSHSAFSTRTSLPNYPSIPALPNSFYQRLRALTSSQLQFLTNGLLSNDERAAILARRLLILNWQTPS